MSSFALAGPPGIKKSLISNVSGQSNVYTFTVSWTPSLSQTGRHALCADATDSYGYIPLSITDKIKLDRIYFIIYSQFIVRIKET